MAPRSLLLIVVCSLVTFPYRSLSLPANDPLSPDPTASKSSKTTENVHTQYTNLPYPPRRPSDELDRLLSDVSPAYLDFFALGKRTMTMPLSSSPAGPARILAAGGGTGAMVVFLAEICARFVREEYPYRCGGREGVELYHLDLSEASIDIARERLEVRNLPEAGTTVTFLQGSLLDLESAAGRKKLGLPEDVEFDLINSSGVLHHLSSPVQGLRALNSVLKDGGGMFIMVYGSHGRTGVYDVQSALRDMNVDTVANPQQCLDLIKGILAALPENHRLQKTVMRMAQGDMFQEDSEMYDIFCHSQDKSYSVEEVFELIASGGGGDLRMASWHQPILYDPSTYIEPTNETKLLTQHFMAVEDDVKKFALAEKLGGSVHAKHQFFLKKDVSSGAGGDAYIGREWKAPNFWTEEFAGSIFCSSLEEDTKGFTKDMWGESFSESWKADQNLSCLMQFDGATATGNGVEISKSFPCSVMRIISLLDCRRTVEDIVKAVAEAEGLGPRDWWAEEELALETIWIVVTRLFKLGQVVPLLETGGGGGRGGGDGDAEL